ncbi:MAG: lysoplasmalogenase, partial [Myxococcales bacterium]
SPLLASTLVAQTAGWGGDIGLLGDGTTNFLAGTGSFGVGHLAYVAGFRRVRRRDHGSSALGPLAESVASRAVLGSGLVMGPTLGLAASRKDRRLGVPVTAYAGLLSTMAAHSANLSPAQPRLARAFTTAGALTFLASDATLGIRKFVMKSPPPWMERTVMATYTSAQLMLAEGAVRAR